MPVTFTDAGPEFGKDRQAITVNILGGRSNTHRYCMTDDASLFIVQIDPSARSGEATSLELVVGWRSVVGTD